MADRPAASVPGSNRATLDSGIIVSGLVQTAVPVEDAALPEAPMELVARLRTALAATELIELVCEARRSFRPPRWWFANRWQVRLTC